MSVDFVPVDDLVTVDEIAKRMHWSLNSTLNIVQGRCSRYRQKFPKPLIGNAKRGVWLWSDILDWYSNAEPKRAQMAKLEDQAVNTTYKQPNWGVGRKTA